MAAVNPPFVIQDQSHASDIFRRMVRALRISPGAVGSGDLAVTQNGTPNMSVIVAAGLAIVDGTQDTTHQGSYVCLNDAAVTLTIAAADPTNPRIDIVVAKVQDSQYSGATDAWSLAVVTGTPAPSPSAPVAPANSMILAQVAVAALATTIVSANITDTRTFAGQFSQSALPTISNQAANLTATVQAGSTDRAGKIQFNVTTATIPSGTRLFTVTFQVAYPQLPSIVISGWPGASGALNFFLANPALVSFDVISGNTVGISNNQGVSYRVN